MNKAELIEKIAKQTKLSKRESEDALNALVSTIQKGLKKKQAVRVAGLGSFITQKRAARQGRNPQTGQSMKIPSKIVAKFRPSSKLRELVK